MSAKCLVPLLLLGCSSDETEDSDPAPLDSAPADSGQPPADSGLDDVRPVIESADAYCYLADEYYQWVVECQADDPQGADTLAEFGDYEHSVTVYLSGTAINSYALICSDEGSCTGTFKESEDGVICKNATSYRFGFLVWDEQGNQSELYTIKGRQG